MTLAADNAFDGKCEQFLGLEHPGARARLAVSATFGSGDCFPESE
ncbi:MAG TPA: hypothetical protein VNM24_04545 [Burkholderiales bacterium]|nr:hypothetical protein [Burkholderiales bacterium]